MRRSLTPLSQLRKEKKKLCSRGRRRNTRRVLVRTRKNPFSAKREGVFLSFVHFGLRSTLPVIFLLVLGEAVAETKRKGRKGVS